MSQIAKDRHAWVDFAKGICIVAVVTLYTTNYVNAELNSANWMNHWIAFAKPFRMPDFFLLSGLFLSRVIDRPWRKYLDNKVVHYLYFLVLWTAIIIPFTWHSREMSPSVLQGVKDIVWFLYDPWAMLWFMQMLALYFVVTRLTRHVPAWVMLPLAALWQMFPFDTGSHPLNAFGERYVFFYAGYLFASRFFAFAEWVRQHPTRALVMLGAWAVVNQTIVSIGWSELPGVMLTLGFVGACAVMAVAALIQDMPRLQWLRYLGQNSIVVYLGFYLPMRFFIGAFVALGLHHDAGTMAVAIGVLSIVSAVALFRVTTGNFMSFLFKRPTWAHLPERRPPAVKAAPTLRDSEHMTLT